MKGFLKIKKFGTNKRKLFLAWKLNNVYQRRLLDCGLDLKKNDKEAEVSNV